MGKKPSGSGHLKPGVVVVVVLEVVVEGFVVVEVEAVVGGGAPVQAATFSRSSKIHRRSI